MITRPFVRASRLCCRSYATTIGTTPPMLLKIRKDMKSAMQNKDADRLSVLRSLLTQALNASKTSTPISTDLQMLALIHKTAKASRTASEEFRGAGRQDLADKEDSQLRIMDEYAQGVDTMGEEEIRATVQSVVDAMRSEGAKMQVGEVLKRVFTPEAIGDKPVQRGDVANIVKQFLAGP